MNFAVPIKPRIGLIDAWLLDALLPHGGYLIAQAEAYFDESGSHSDSHLLCVAGYILSKRQARLLSADWTKMLRRYGLTCFHMVDCAHGNGEFANLPKKDRIEAGREVISLIKKHAVLGLAVTINEDEFTSLMPHHPSVGSPYSFCAHVILAGVAHWLKQRPDVLKCAYFFEAGHSSQSEANGIMKKIFENEELSVINRYAAHSFVRKNDSAAIQAADMLAWQYFKDTKNKLEGRQRRLDCKSLFEHRHEVLHISREKIESLAQRFANRAPTINDMVTIHLGDD